MKEKSGVPKITKEIPQVAYYRVSTQKQGQSGLGLEAQQAAVMFFIHKVPDFEFIEIESGKKSNREQLKKAIATTKNIGGRLVIAKLDRLSRNVHFLSGLMESKVNFVCCDNPNATPMILHILAAVAEDEAKRISQRTKDALQAKKERGVLLGSPKGIGYEYRIDAIRDGKISKEEYLRQRRVARGYSEYKHNAINAVEMLLDFGFGVTKILDYLNENGIKTPNGSSTWYIPQVYRIIKAVKDVRPSPENKEENRSIAINSGN